MAVATLSHEDFDTNNDDRYLGLFCLIWLDANINAKETRDTEQNLRSIINNLKKFQDVKQCQEFIERRSQNDRLILIVSGQLGKEIMPCIHKIRQVISVYVYCMNKKSNEKWACKFAKVKGVVVELDELVSRIKTDHKIQKKVEEPLSINIFTASADSGTSTMGVNGEFVFSQVLIDCLLRLKSTQVDTKELINHCKNEYEGNQIELSNIREFQQDYSPKKVLQWYTRESFFYKTLNAALRTQNIHLIFLFRSFISDLRQRLQDYQATHRLRVYRSQVISSDELELLKQSLGQLISINSFFSTSTDYWKALSFLDLSDTSGDLERIVFEINADPKIVTTKPFADISKDSVFSDEAEVLFMIGSIFRLKSIKRDENQVWIIQMTLCSDDENDLKQVLTYMKKQIGSGETNLRTLGKVLCRMGKFDLADKYFKRLLKELPSNHPLISSVYEDLGQLASQTGHFDMSVQWHQKSLALKNEIELSTNSNINEIKTFSAKSIPSTHSNEKTKRIQDSVSITEGHTSDNQLNCPYGIYVDDDNQSIFIADWGNHRIVEWKCDTKNSQVVAGGNGNGNRMDQLSFPTDVIVDKKNDSLIICDWGNRRVVRWPRRHGTNVLTIISNIRCSHLAMDNDGDLYVSDSDKHDVKRWKKGQRDGTTVAGGNGKGCNLNQLDNPTYIFVDQDYAIYISDENNHRVMKWMNGSKEGRLVAGGQGEGNSLAQLSRPAGVIVDQLGRVYVSDSRNHRIMRWLKGSKDGSIVAGRNGKTGQPNELNGPNGLSFDRQGNLYVTSQGNHLVQKFSID
ncbi:unnamed protein product [Rotaria magnacalcarata]|uniref:Uncharacterized protein n=1 Tax=Rotaria magnacalcarata TaxID=392030 RepID=A0A819RIN2_9BILA|nr:unnamed protein product [Rotaria magnacalcarata]CAF2178076.1 unnamed protein product [Rotaria magnacalcarata]CAF2184203.1 unnamed protein product [Rotaria magnacalcarata]CAF4025919.1 unnamed protein product [Rotaria magnacalcarata]CAF4053037.1 unnamed protein product [Rotaria magnacalcarata]